MRSTAVQNILAHEEGEYFCVVRQIFDRPVNAEYEKISNVNKTMKNNSYADSISMTNITFGILSYLLNAW